MRTGMGPETLADFFIHCTHNVSNTDNSLHPFCCKQVTIGVVMCYRLDDNGVGIDSWQGQEFSLPYNVHASSGAHPVPVALSLGIKHDGLEADHSPPN
jgi:hypothetical protein